MPLICHATFDHPGHPGFLPQILDRLESFQARFETDGAASVFTYGFGTARIIRQDDSFRLEGAAPDAAGLGRLKDLLATAFRLYAKDAPPILWHGDLAGDPRLDSFRLMTVLDTARVSASMQRIRLAAEGLDRFAAFGNMHVRLLLPTTGNPDPVWPVAGPDGLALWPDLAKKPVPRVYTIRRMDAVAGWVDIDLLLHGTEGPGSAFAHAARPGDPVGMIGPLGRPLKSGAETYLMGADDTGIPAVARLLETLPETTTGHAFIEVTGPEDVQDIQNRTRITLDWLFRGDQAEGEMLAEAVLDQGWPHGPAPFGWFAAEAGPASRIRRHWREGLGLGRDTTLAANYWKRGVAGVMAG